MEDLSSSLSSAKRQQPSPPSNNSSSPHKKSMIDWKQKCVKRFGLTPVPAHVQQKVGTFSSETWRRYFEFRVQQQTRKTDGEDEEIMDSDDSDDNDDIDGGDDSDNSDDNDDPWDEDEGRSLLKRWNQKLDELLEELSLKNGGGATNTDSLWPCHLTVEDVWMDEDEIRSADFAGFVWSPYEIPVGIQFIHPYHYRAGCSSITFRSSFEYSFLNFACHPKYAKPQNKLCSVCYEDPELQFEVIDDTKLTLGRMKLMKRHLWGSEKTQIGKNSISDFDFARLMFASMGLFDFETIKAPYDGHVWDPKSDDELNNQMKKDKYCRSISWLEYATRKATNALYPTDKCYKPPKLEDAPGYDENSIDNEFEHLGLNRYEAALHREILRLLEARCKRDEPGVTIEEGKDLNMEEPVPTPYCKE